jgi:hypothetical protein
MMIPSAKQVIHIELPPLLIKGNVCPVTGNSTASTAYLPLLEISWETQSYDY